MTKLIEHDRFWAKVDKTDTCWLWTASTCGTGYGKIWVRNGGAKKLVSAHRLSYEVAVGAIPKDMEIDHICRNRICVKPDHLRAVTKKENGENRTPAGHGASGVRGVHWNARDSKWYAYVGHNRKKIYAGYFDSLEDAESAVIAKRNEIYTHNDADRQVIA